MVHPHGRRHQGVRLHLGDGGREPGLYRHECSRHLPAPMSELFDLTGRVAIVTGANTGIGQGLAIALGEAGADVALVGRTPAEETAERVRAGGRRAAIIGADLSSIAPVQEIVDRTLAELGGLDILVNNAGIIRRADALDFSEEDWDAVIDTNLKSVFFLCQAAARHMVPKGRGKIVNIASMLSF